MDDSHRNVELKATDPDPDRSLAVCRRLGARDEGDLWQRDTYFAVAHGGLKLREQKPGVPHLIQFARADRPEQRESRYRIADVADGAATRAVLEAVLGVTCVVVKRRRLFLWNDVRIHLDRVEGLGAFVELEAVAPPESDLTIEHEHVAFLREALSIGDERLVPHGYSVLLAQASTSPRRIA